MVAVQLNTLIAEGTATKKLFTEKTIPAYMDWLDTKRWCPQTRNPSTAIPIQLPQVQVNRGNLLYSFTEPFGVSSITYGAQWSATLQPSDWHTVADTGDPSATPPEHLFSVPMGGNSQVFIRLTVTIQ